MDPRIIDVLRLKWPKSIPAHEYENALLLAQLFSSEAPKPEAAHPERAQEDLISIKDAAKLVGVSGATIYARVKSGRLQAIKNGGRTQVSQAEVVALEPGPRLVHSVSVAADAPEGSISIKEAAREYRVDRRLLYKAAQRGHIKPVAKVKGIRGLRAVFAKADIESLLQRRGQ